MSVILKKPRRHIPARPGCWSSAETKPLIQSRLVLTLYAAAVNPGPSNAVAGIATEMLALVAVPVAGAVGIVKRTVIAPIAVMKRAIGAVIVAIVIISTVGAHAVMVAIGAAAEQGQPGKQSG